MGSICQDLPLSDHPAHSPAFLPEALHRTYLRLFSVNLLVSSAALVLDVKKERVSASVQEYNPGGCSGLVAMCPF